MTGTPPLHDSGRVLVVGTTSDYIDWIRRVRPGRALFLTEKRQRTQAIEQTPNACEEILVSLDTPPHLLSEIISNHLKLHAMTLRGVACFDCERLTLAAELAALFGLFFPSVEAVRRCRDKSLSKSLWHTHGIPCPRGIVPQSEDHLIDSVKKWSQAVVLKPRSGSGSELTFRCDSLNDTREAYRRITATLASKRHSPMYREVGGEYNDILAEEWITGIEFSCDFLVQSHEAKIVRLSRKYPLRNAPFGTTAAYELIDTRRFPLDSECFRGELVRVAESLGIERAWCMADFIVRDQTAFFLEIAPRPGGDCLPWLLRATTGYEVLGAMVDFASCSVVKWDDDFSQKDRQGGYFARQSSTAHGVGLRLFARREGTLRQIETRHLTADPRVVEVYLRRRAGDQIVLPPNDYDSWILGHVVYLPDAERSVTSQNEEIAKLVNLKWEQT